MQGGYGRTDGRTDVQTDGKSPLCQYPTFYFLIFLIKKESRLKKNFKNWTVITENERGVRTDRQADGWKSPRCQFLLFLF